ncbi:hypothetical protein SFR_2773 [Streptomyces sp. FR-008]|nr:hypothetical protein SFR_2773 [Streptomyces sp. FR-008]
MLPARHRASVYRCAVRCVRGRPARRPRRLPRTFPQPPHPQRFRLA